MKVLNKHISFYTLWEKIVIAYNCSCYLLWANDNLKRAQGEIVRLSRLEMVQELGRHRLKVDPETVDARPGADNGESNGNKYPPELLGGGALVESSIFLALFAPLSGGGGKKNRARPDFCSPP